MRPGLRVLGSLKPPKQMAERQAPERSTKSYVEFTPKKRSQVGSPR